MNTKLHAVTDTSGRPIQFFITAGQVSDYTGAAALLSSLQDAEWLLADRGYGADWFREALIDMGITPCIPGRKSRSKTIKYHSRDIAAQYPAGQGTSAVTNAATASSECSAGSKTGDVSQPVMTAAQSILVSNRPRCNRHIFVMSAGPRIRVGVYVVIDHATRCVVGLRVVMNGSADETVRVLEMATCDKTAISDAVGTTFDWVEGGGFSMVVSDQGSEFANDRYETAVLERVHFNRFDIRLRRRSCNIRRV